MASAAIFSNPFSHTRAIRVESNAIPAARRLSAIAIAAIGLVGATLACVIFPLSQAAAFSMIVGGVALFSFTALSTSAVDDSVSFTTHREVELLPSFGEASYPVSLPTSVFSRPSIRSAQPVFPSQSHVKVGGGHVYSAPSHNAPVLRMNVPPSSGGSHVIVGGGHTSTVPQRPGLTGEEARVPVGSRR